MHIYESGPGRFWLGGKDLRRAYSGHAEGKNNPLLQHVPNLGPIPSGAWLLGDVEDSPTHGPVSIRLVHLAGELYGRSAFLIHGDSRTHPGEASYGCIIADRPDREWLADSRDRLLVVFPELPRLEAA